MSLPVIGRGASVSYCCERDGSSRIAGSPGWVADSASSSVGVPSGVAPGRGVPPCGVAFGAGVPIGVVPGRDRSGIAIKNGWLLCRMTGPPTTASSDSSSAWPNSSALW
jgi:hypothetical protein